MPEYLWICCIFAMAYIVGVAGSDRWVSSIPNLHFLCRIYPLNAFYISINMHLYIVSDSRIHAELEKAIGRKRCGVESHGPMRSQAQ